MTIPYQPGVIYGPVNSRRLGASLGLNILPFGKKFCSFNCIYCQYGWTEAGARMKKIAETLPTYDKIREVLKDKLSTFKNSQLHLDYITFSGNGEPTLHPDFHKIVDLAIELKNKYYPDAKTAILSNSSNINKERVSDALNKLDVRIMKLDAGTEEVFQRINKPVFKITLADIVSGIKKLEPVHIQAMFLKGINDSGDNITEWIKLLKEIEPVHIQIYSLDRPPADDSLVKLDFENLKKIVEMVRRESGLKIDAF